MYKILIKYTSANKKIFWQSYNMTDENGNIVEFETDSIEVLKNELNKLDKIYGNENLRAVVDVTYDITVNMPNELVSVVSPEEILDIYNTAFTNVFKGEE